MSLAASPFCSAAAVFTADCETPINHLMAKSLCRLAESAKLSANATLVFLLCSSDSCGLYDTTAAAVSCILSGRSVATAARAGSRVPGHPTHAMSADFSGAPSYRYGTLRRRMKVDMKPGEQAPALVSLTAGVGDERTLVVGLGKIRRREEIFWASGKFLCLAGTVALGGGRGIFGPYCVGLVSSCWVCE
ncbi:hypothetical protein B0T16DRAFT_142120 [Cercophora newfieldiana]|uniref:Uncharacterized protein n=1 Tax=Cercophora newfieldiana TaxID=92897 RepID=A0AA39Y4H3_9PEZI|nr:hypothetical protein B0T16DRAFT_142120 [Cercophora newfieldiana]